jgi:signal transduction histidine kinase
MIRSLYGRIAIAFALLMLAFSGFIGWLSVTTVAYHQQELVQRLNRGLAEHIAAHLPLLGADGFDQKAIEDLFHMLMVVNPSIEVYLLDTIGKIEAHLAPDGHLKRDHIDLTPIRRFLAEPGGAALPILGDDPRNASGRQIFSAAALTRQGEVDRYLYVILAGEAHRELAAHLWEGRIIRTAGTISATALILTILVGLAVFAAITRRLNALTRVVERRERRGFATHLEIPDRLAKGQDEIAHLARAFQLMAQRITQQIRELQHQDRLRRELVANICHDFRTPLTALHGYLEAMQRKARGSEPDERDRYLEIALQQSDKVGRLAQELFDLAHLEHAGIEPRLESFSLAELVQDVLQKFELRAKTIPIELYANISHGSTPVVADIGMIERVLVNLLDNALRHTPAGGKIRIDIAQKPDKVGVSIADTGSGIGRDQLPLLFDRASPLGRRPGRVSGGLGLLIVKRILTLHHCEIHVDSLLGKGTVFRFELPSPAFD